MHIETIGRSTALLLACVLAGCLDQRETLQIQDCEATAGMVPDCRFVGPVDLAVIPDQQGIILSQPTAAGGAGQLLFYQPQAPAPDNLHVLYPGAAFVPMPDWGDADCPPPEAPLEPKGMDLVQRSDGALALLVVNQGERQAVEFFGLAAPGEAQATTAAAASTLAVAAVPTPPGLYWHGCVKMPAHASFGDLAGDPDGGFWATQSFPSDRPNRSYLRARLGLATGYVYRWQPTQGFTQVPGTRSRLPKGIARSADGNYLFYATYMGDEVRKLDLAAGAVVASTRVLQPNNLSWGLDGSLLVASHTADFLERGGCDLSLTGACGFAFEVLAIYPEDMSSALLLAHQGAPIGAVDVAVNLGDSLYLASSLGDRIVRLVLEPEG